MDKSKKRCTNIYEMSLCMKRVYPDKSNKDILIHTLYAIGSEPFIDLCGKKVPSRDFLGNNAYLDILNFKKRFKEGNFEDFFEQEYLIKDFNCFEPNSSTREKFEEIRKYVSKEKDENSEKYHLILDLLIAGLIAKEHFPISGLESMLIAKGIKD